MSLVSRPFRLLALCAVTSILLTGCTNKNAKDDGTSGPLQNVLPGRSGTELLQVADRIPAPTIRGETLDGSTIDLASMRGKVVVMNFWASWCNPCRAESPNLVKVANDNAARGVAFVGVNIKDERSAARRFDEVHAVPYPSLFDQPGIILTRLHKLIPQQPPSTLLIDRTGRIAGIFRGGVTETELSGPVQALAAEPA
jgi:thiol-disulfide isomerase/thioredoxin